MAIAHYQITSVSRAAGGTAANAVDYALGQGRHWRKAADVIAHGHIGPVVDWSAVDARVDRSTRAAVAKVARTGDYALPHKLADRPDVLEQIVREHLTMICDHHQIAATYSLQRAPEDGDERNIHCHPVFVTRRVAADGSLGAKARELDDRKTSAAHLEAWRQDWQARINAALQAHGHAARIDMRSYERQGRAELPTRHLGPEISARTRKGFPSERKNRNDAILDARRKRAALTRAERRLASHVRQRADREVNLAGGVVARAAITSRSAGRAADQRGARKRGGLTAVRGDLLASVERGQRDLQRDGRGADQRQPGRIGDASAVLRLGGNDAVGRDREPAERRHAQEGEP